ncbi:sensor histidine kinase [Egicoccus halophilus]|uniref:Histidine kinase n=1 Tax=Egicoccus halophilus TaxID=1670830 RepID=A0A8J3AB77_9ACTN|nr:sensor histidine kinase [Egicoccus halophilus]GGI07173.1 histidine kinase [Egicoccus halophilus]
MTTSSASVARAPRRISGYWYLAYLLMLVWQPAFDPSARWWHWALAGGAALGFAVLFVVAEERGGAVREWLPWIATGLGIALLTVNVGASVFLIYAAAAASMTRPRQPAIRWMTALSVLAVVLALVHPVDMVFRLITFLPTVVFLWVVGMACIEDRERDVEAARLRVDNARIAHLATATERERIARDLHDLTGHSLTSIVVRAQLVQRLAPTDPTRAAAEAVEIEQVARAALTEIRETLAGWRQVALDDEVEVARQALERVGVDLHVVLDRDVVLAPSVEQALGLALREAVTNVVRHAQARHCTIRLSEQGDEVRLEVVDDGIGASAQAGNGLRGMQERMTALGGQVQRVTSAGTRLVVTVPQDVAG